MSDKFVYQNARVKSLEKTLFSSQSVARLLDCATKDEVYKTLVDFGIGSGVNAEDGDFDALFKKEEENAAEFLREFNVDNVLDVFLIHYDFLNLKILIKSRLSGKAPNLAPVGRYQTDEIMRFLADENSVPDEFEEPLKAIRTLKDAGKLTPHRLDCIVDKGEYACIFRMLSKKDSKLKRYFKTKVDFLNLNTFLRAKRLGLDKKYVEESLISGGSLDFLTDIYDESLETLGDRVRYTDYAVPTLQAIESGNLTAFEVYADNALLKMWKEDKDDLFSVSPIVSFYLSKIADIRISSLIVAGVKNGVDRQKIKERMRDIYA